MYKDFTNYEIFEDGRIWSKTSNRWLKPYKNRKGYLYVCLCDNDGKKHTTTLHKAVYFAVNSLWCFPEGMQINHIDENKENNHISNLELVTPKHNLNYGTRNERAAKAISKALKGKIPVANPPKRVGAFNENSELVMVFDSTAEAQRNGYAASAVSRCCRNCFNYEGNNKYKGFTWKFLDEQ